MNIHAPLGLDARDLEFPAPDSRRWWVIHTRPRCEKKMDLWLTRHGMEHYLPLRSRARVYASKKVSFEHPIFAGYAFGSFSLRERNAVYGSGHAASILEVVDQDRFLDEISAIRRALAAGIEATEVPFLAIGQRARITTGKLRGLEGLIQRRAGRTRMILSVELLQRSVSLEVEPDWLEPLG